MFEIINIKITLKKSVLKSKMYHTKTQAITKFKYFPYSSDLIKIQIHSHKILVNNLSLKAGICLM